MLRAAGGHEIVGDLPFTPEIEYDGSYYPVCGNSFWDNHEGATAICRHAGFQFGGRVIRTNAAYATNAMPVGKCKMGEDIESCTGGYNAFGDFMYDGGACTVGNLVGVQVVCSYQARS